MTKHLQRMQAAFRDTLLERGTPLQKPLPPTARDGYAALWTWEQCGYPIHRLTAQDLVAARAGLPPDLRLATAATRGPALAYQLPERDQWIVLARIVARDPIEVSPDARYAYSETMLCYVTEIGDWAIGCINLDKSPTVSTLQIAPGKMYRELYSQPLDRDDIKQEVMRIAMALPHFYFFGNP